MPRRFPRPRDGLFRIIGYLGLLVSGTAGIRLSPSIQQVAFSWQAATLGALIIISTIFLVWGRLADESVSQQVSLALLAGVCLWILTIFFIAGGLSGVFISGFVWCLGWLFIDRIRDISVLKKQQMEFLKYKAKRENGGDGS
jgi:hypothetical protein